MNYVFDILIDPLECESLSNVKLYKKYPDEFRQYYFDLTTKLEYIEDINKMAYITNTKKKYWSKDYDIVKKLELEINKYSSLPKHLLTDYLNNETYLEAIHKKYYKKIYDLTDIIIISDNSDNSLLMSALKNILSDGNGKNHILIRITIYLSYFYTKKYYRKKSLSIYCKTIKNKLKSFLEEPNIFEYFTKNELQNYLSDIDKYYRASL